MKRKPTKSEWALCMLLDGKLEHDLIDNGGLPEEYLVYISELRYEIQKKADVFNLELDEVKDLKE